MIRYYFRWAKTAFTHSLGIIDLWIGVVTATLGVADYYWPQAHLMSSALLIPVWVLATVVAARLLIAPYWMWQEDRQKRLRQHILNDGVKWVEIAPNSLTALSADFGVDAPPLQFSAMATTTRRLRTFVDYCSRQAWGQTRGAQKLGCR